MHTRTHHARSSAHLSRRERHRLARTAAFSRRTPAPARALSPVMLEREQLELIDRLVRSDRTAVSTALLVIAGIGAGEATRRAVLDRVSEAAGWAQAEGAITAQRSQQIARHVELALDRHVDAVAA